MEGIARRRAGETVARVGTRRHRAKDGRPIFVDVSRVAYDGGVGDQQHPVG